MSIKTAPFGTRTKSVLIAGLDSLFLVLTSKLGDRFQFVNASDFLTARDAFDQDQPSILICGIDDADRQFQPLFRIAKRHNTSILAVGSTEEALANIDEVSWAVDKRAHEAILDLVKKLAEKPYFVPNDPDRYPPPPKASNRTGNGGVKIVKSAFVSEGSSYSSSPPPPASRTERSADSLRTQIGLPSPVPQGPSTEAIPVHSLLSLVRRIESLEERTQTSSANLSERIDTLSQEGQSAIAELRDSIKHLLTDSRSSIPSIDGHVERLSEALDQRESDIDLLQQALAQVETHGAERESDLKRHIVKLEKQVFHIETTFEKISVHESGGVSVSLDTFAKLESRLDAIEAAFAEFETTSPSKRGAHIAQEFDSIWETQSTLSKMKQQLDWVEEQLTAVNLNGDGQPIPSVTPHPVLLERIEATEETQSLLKENLDDLRRDLSELTRAVENQNQSITQQLAPLTGSIKAAGNLETQMEKINAAQAAVLNRLHILENARMGQSPPSYPEGAKTVKSWPAEPRKDDGVTQRSIIRTSSEPPKPAHDNGSRDKRSVLSERRTLIGQKISDLPSALSPTLDDETDQQRYKKK